MDQHEARHLNFLVIRFAMFFWLAGWYCKAYFFLPYFLDVAFRVPIVHPLFPAYFLNPLVSVIFYLAPAMVIPAILRPSRPRLIFSSILMSVSALMLLLHINSYNDATFVTSFWVGLWVWWLCVQSERADTALPQQAYLLAQLIIGVIFFGGFVGKFTPEYLSGRAFYYIFWGDSNKLWPHGWIMAHFTPEQLKAVSLYFSTFIVFTELLLACAPLFRSRFIFILAPGLLACFMITNTWAIFSVVGCLIGMMLACLFYKRDSFHQHA